MTQPSPVVALVPTYNGSRYLRETLTSLAAQDHPSLRVLVSDDASSDETPEICAAFAGDRRFTVIRQPSRLGWVENSNALLAEVGDEHAFFAPHDDIFHPTYARRLSDALASRPDAVLAFADTTAIGRAKVFRALDRGTHTGSRVRRALPYLPDAFQERCLPFRGLVRSGALARVGPLRRSSLGEFDADGRWLFRLALLGPFVRVPEALSEKRLHEMSLAGSWTYRRRIWMRDALTYIPEARRAGLGPVELGALTAAALGQAGLHLCPPRVRNAVRPRR